MITIDKEFKALIPPLTAEEYAQLEENCVREGIRDPITIWETPSGNRILVDGHNRFEIAAKHGLTWTENIMHFDLREDAMAWIIRNQFGRRNLSAYDRSLLALKLKPMIAKEAKKQQRAAGGAVPQKSVKAIDTQKELAKVAGVSHDTIHRVEVIEEKATPEEKAKLRSGELSINQVYTAHALSKRVDPVKQAAKEHEEFQKAKEESVVSFKDAVHDKSNQKILALDFYTKCLKLGDDVFWMYAQIKRGEINTKEMLKHLEDGEVNTAQSRLRDIIKWCTAISSSLVKE